MNPTMELLQLTRDAWDSGRLSESWRLMAMVEVDCEYDRRTARRRVTKRPRHGVGRWQAWITRFMASSEAFDIGRVRWSENAWLPESTERSTMTQPLAWLWSWWGNENDSLRSLYLEQRPLVDTRDEWPDASKYFERWAKVRVQYPSPLQFMDGV